MSWSHGVPKHFQPSLNLNFELFEFAVISSNNKTH